MSRIEVPSELMPSDRMEEEAKKMDDDYKKLYSDLLESVESHSPSDVIGIIASIRAEQVSLLIGANLTKYDKKILYGLIERHIAGIVSSEEEGVKYED